MARSLAFAVLALVHCCAGLLVQHRVTPFTAASHRSCLRTGQPLLAEGESESKVKITIKPPSSGSGDAAATAESSSESSGMTTKIKVNVKPKTDAAPEVAAVVDDEDTKVTIKVNKIKKDLSQAPIPDDRPARQPRSEAEELLLNATQAANCTRLIKALQMGANPNIRDPNGRTPLHFCAGIGLAPACVILVHFGAQLDVRDNGGLTPMHMAAGYANAQTLKVLVEAGADPTISGDEQGSPLEVVTSLGEYQYEQVWKERKKSKNPLERLKKKDEKLEKLKKCMEMLEDPEKVRAESVWDETVLEVLKTLAV
jgi:hypothetical protein